MTTTQQATCTPSEAAEIMGDNFHGIDALERHMNVKLSEESKQHFEIVPFSTKMLQACHETHVLVACGPLSLMDVYRSHRDLFFDMGNVPWFGFTSDEFGHFKVKASWYLVRKNSLPTSTDKTWYEEHIVPLVHNDQEPSASVLAQVILIHYLETTERLYETGYALTSDVDSDGLWPFLGGFDQDGLFVSDDWYITDIPPSA